MLLFVVLFWGYFLIEGCGCNNFYFSSSSLKFLYILVTSIPHTGPGFVQASPISVVASFIFFIPFRTGTELD